MNCLENLHICKASCCRKIFFRTVNEPGRYLIFNVMSLDRKRYYELHGIKISRTKDRKYILDIPGMPSDWKLTHESKKKILIEIPLVCQALKNNKCSLHGTNKKPSICRYLNEETAKDEKIVITEGCILKNKEDDKIERNRSN